MENKFIDSLILHKKTSDLDFKLDCIWDNYGRYDICNIKLHNNSIKPVKPGLIELFNGNLVFSKNTKLYGEGYNMLAQYYGTLSDIYHLGYHDVEHYKMPNTSSGDKVYSLVLLQENEMYYLVAFSSSLKFRGEFLFEDSKIKILVDLENKEILPDESIDLEELFFAKGKDFNELYDMLGKQINKNHPVLKFKETPVGWCSWYYYGENITENDILDNMRVIKEKIPQLKYVQIDDGYQRAMGDWLIPGKSFTKDIKKLCLNIKEQGFEPAIWVAPFIAEEKSYLFQNHPEWFIKDDNYKPLSSGEVSYGGWRNGPWYMLDTTNPEACAFLTQTFRTLYKEWGCTYFKLDANMWGALPFGNRYDNNATSIEAYRQGMKAILEGVGEECFILGCNAPMWTSLGLVHGMRVTEDISRKWKVFVTTAKEGLSRSWQHKKLWINDPDCIVLGPRVKNNVTEDEFAYHTTFIAATGGMVLSGDNLCILEERKIELLKDLIPPTGIAASFETLDFNIGKTIIDENTQFIYLLNDKDDEIVLSVTLDTEYNVYSVIDQNYLGKYKGVCSFILKPHSGKILKCSKR